MSEETRESTSSRVGELNHELDELRRQSQRGQRADVINNPTFDAAYDSAHDPAYDDLPTMPAQSRSIRFMDEPHRPTSELFEPPDPAGAAAAAAAATTDDGDELARVKALLALTQAKLDAATANGAAAQNGAAADVPAYEAMGGSGGTGSQNAPELAYMDMSGGSFKGSPGIGNGGGGGGDDGDDGDYMAASDAIPAHDSAQAAAAPAGPVEGIYPDPAQAAAATAGPEEGIYPDVGGSEALLQTQTRPPRPRSVESDSMLQLARPELVHLPPQDAPPPRSPTDDARDLTLPRPPAYVGETALPRTPAYVGDATLPPPKSPTEATSDARDLTLPRTPVYVGDLTLPRTPATSTQLGPIPTMSFRKQKPAAASTPAPSSSGGGGGGNGNGGLPGSRPGPAADAPLGRHVTQRLSKLNGSQAAEELKHAAVGSFIIRESASFNGQLAISVRIPENGQPGGHVSNKRIVYDGQRKAYHLVAIEGRHFKSLGAFVQFYSTLQLDGHLPVLLRADLSAGRGPGGSSQPRIATTARAAAAASAPPFGKGSTRWSGKRPTSPGWPCGKPHPAVPWLRMAFSRPDAERVLAHQPPGSFLIRNAASSGGHCLALSIQRGPSFGHELIEIIVADGCQHFSLRQAGVSPFGSLQAFVEHYSNPMLRTGLGIHLVGLPSDGYDNNPGIGVDLHGPPRHDSMQRLSQISHFGEDTDL